MTEGARHTEQPLPGWFRIAAIGSVIWYLLGCASYLYQVTVDPAGLPADQRAMLEAAPTWMYAAFAIGVWVGLAGAIMLLMRKRLAPTLLLVSLVAAIAQFAAYFADPELRAVVSSGGLTIPAVIIAISALVTWFAHRARRRGWLH